MKRLRTDWQRFVHVDTAQLEENHEFKLTPLSETNTSLEENLYKLKLLEDPLQEVFKSPYTSSLVPIIINKTSHMGARRYEISFRLFNSIANE